MSSKLIWVGALASLEGLSPAPPRDGGAFRGDPSQDARSSRLNVVQLRAGGVAQLRRPSTDLWLDRRTVLDEERDQLI